MYTKVNLFIQICKVSFCYELKETVQGGSKFFVCSVYMCVCAYIYIYICVCVYIYYIYTYSTYKINTVQETFQNNSVLNFIQEININNKNSIS